MIMSGAGLLKKNPRPTEAEIQQAMEGNICRCGTYPRIVAAVRQASGNGRKGGAR
jgi:isoquinoline 1-oxidoreductase alpha subunit